MAGTLPAQARSDQLTQGAAATHHPAIGTTLRHGSLGRIDAIPSRDVQHKSSVIKK
jgi:hypothetical protein